ncbi:MAG: hypothetical protein QNJ98_05395 [Planctomycetota bacterium]|nr:hypothetical protein [Planctomycetota bacterium]
MRRSIPLALVLGLSLALAGCGDDGGTEGGPMTPYGSGGPSLPYGIDPSKIDMEGKEGIEAAKHVGEQFMKGITNTKLTEEGLSKLYDLHKKLEAAADSDDITAKMAILREHGMQFGAYTANMMKLSTLQSLLRGGLEGAKKKYDKALEQVDQMKEQAKSATGDAKAAAEQRLQMVEMMLPGLKAQVEQAKELEDPKFRAMIEKWAAKFDELNK